MSSDVNGETEPTMTRLGDEPSRVSPPRPLAAVHGSPAANYERPPTAADTVDQTDYGCTSEAATILAAVRELIPLIVTRRDEIERGRRLPVDLVECLRTAGCFRMLVPRRLGGAEASLSEHLQLVRELAIADGSVGWTVMIGSSAPMILGMLPTAAFDTVYADGPDVVGAGTFNPTGAATVVDGGFQASGRWAFASGCEHADWFVAHCMVDDGSMPPLRMMVLPASEVRIIDTWTVSGLCGTGSHDFALDERVRPRRPNVPSLRPGRPRGDHGQDPRVAVRVARGRRGGGGDRRRCARRHHDVGDRQGADVLRWDAGRQPAVPSPARRGRHPAESGPHPARLGGRDHMGDRRDRCRSSPRSGGPGSAAPPPG